MPLHRCKAAQCKAGGFAMSPIVEDCKKASHVVLTGCKGKKIHVCMEHRHRADYNLLVEQGLLWEQTKSASDTERRCQAPRFRFTI